MGDVNSTLPSHDIYNANLKLEGRGCFLEGGIYVYGIMFHSMIDGKNIAIK